MSGWNAWFTRHPDHRVVGLCICHPHGCGRRCLDDRPQSSFSEYLLRSFAALVRSRPDSGKETAE